MADHASRPPGHSRRLTLSVFETAFLLECPESVVRGMLRRRDLADVGVGRTSRVDLAEVATKLATRPVALEALRAIAEGRLIIRKSESCDGSPPGLIATYRSIR